MSRLAMEAGPAPKENYAVMTDEDIVARAQSGDTEAFDALVIRYQDRVYSYARRMLRDPETAAETAQDCFLRAYRYLGGFKGDSKFSTWFYTVVTSTCRNAAAYHGLRDRRRESPAPSGENDFSPDPLDRAPDSSFAPHALAERGDLRASIVRAIESLPEQHRQIIVLKDINEFSYEQIAVILKCRLGTVKSRIARARALLREKLEAAGVTGPECDER